jgi:hypothetical protein
VKAFKNKFLRQIFPQRLTIHRYAALGCRYSLAITRRRPEIFAFFDAEYYASNYLSGRSNYLEALLHFVRHGWKHSLDPNPFIHLSFVKNVYPEQSSSFDKLAILLGGKLYMNSLLRRESTCRELAYAADSNNYEELMDILVFDPQFYHSKQVDLVNIGHPSPIRHLFYHGLKESRLSKSSILRAFNAPFDRSSSDYVNLSNLRMPLTQSGLYYYSSELPENELKSDHAANALSERPSLNLCIGIVFYKNTFNEVRRLIGSVLQNNVQESYKLKLMFYDNCPGETSFPPIDSIPFEIFSDTTNPGFGVGHNRLMSKAFLSGSDIYIGLNPDGFLLPSVLPRILSFIASKPPGSLVELNTFPLPHPKWFDPHTGETEWASGVAFAIDALGYSRTNGFDSSFPMYCEDVDLSFRFKLCGFGVFVTPFSSFWHDIVPRWYQSDDPRRIKSLIGEWCLCSKWGMTDRAEQILKDIARIDDSVTLPSIDPFPVSLPIPIRQLFEYPRYARSLFW